MDGREDGRTSGAGEGAIESARQSTGGRGKVAAIDKQFNDEVSQHANDVLVYRAQLASGAQRLSVHVASCVPASESAGAAGGADGATANADLAPAAADGVAEVAGDDQREIDKLTALQAYVHALEDEGFIERTK